MRRSDRNRSTSSSRSRRHSSSSRAGGCATIGAGEAGVRRTGRPGRRGGTASGAGVAAWSGNGCQALLAGEVRGVDQGLQCLGDLSGPDHAGVRTGLRLPDRATGEAAHSWWATPGNLS